MRSMLARNTVVAKVLSALVKQRQHFVAKQRKTEVILQDIYFRNFLENEHTMVLFWKCDHIQLSE